METTGAHAPKTLLPLDVARANALVTDWDNLPIPVPWFVGRRTAEPSIDDLVPFIDWTSFLSALDVEGRSPAVLDHPSRGAAARELYDRARAMLARFAREGRPKARGVYGFWPANTVGDDIVVYKDDARAAELMRLHTLRQQEPIADGGPNRCLADFVAPKASFAPDYIGAFAVTAGLGLEDLVREFEAAGDDDSAILAGGLAGRLAEAFAESLHAQARKDWGYAADERLSNDDLIAGRYRGIRATFGSPACPDRSDTPALFRLLDPPAAGITLTESFAMRPAASVSGIYLSHPQATHFEIGRIGRDQVEDYAARTGVPVEQVERWLGLTPGG